MEGRQRLVQILATLVTAMLAALVVIGLTATRLGREQGLTPSSSTPVATRDYGPPSEQANLLYVHDPARSNWLTGLDWTGTPQATVKLDPSQAGALMAPDGQTFAIGMNAKGGAWQFLDRLGKPIADRTSLPGALFPIWADDNRHVCATSLDQQTLGWYLWTQLPGEAPHQVRLLATDSSLGETNVRVIACSFKNDVAIAERVVQAWPTEYWVLKLADGSVSDHRTRSGTDVADLVASPDGTLLAENSSKSTGQIDGTSPFTTIRRVSDGGTVSTIYPEMGVLAFSADNFAMLVTLAPWVGGKPVHLAVISVKSWSVVWQDDGTNPLWFGQFVAQPGGGSFAIAYPSSGTYPSPSRIVIVNRDGASTTLDRLYTPAW